MIISVFLAKFSGIKCSVGLNFSLNLWVIESTWGHSTGSIERWQRGSARGSEYYHFHTSGWQMSPCVMMLQGCCCCCCSGRSRSVRCNFMSMMPSVGRLCCGLPVIRASCWWQRPTTICSSCCWSETPESARRAYCFASPKMPSIRRSYQR